MRPIRKRPTRTLGTRSPRWHLPTSASFAATLIFAALGVGCTAMLGGSSSDEDNCATCGDSGTPGDGDGNASGVPPGGLDPAGNPIGVLGVGFSSRYPRLSHKQWDNTIRDLFRLPTSPEMAATFALDPDNAAFDNFGVRTVSGNLWLDYQRAAEAVVEEVTADPSLLNALRPASAPDDATAFITELGRRAFRRPLSESEVNTFADLFASAPQLFPDGNDFENGVTLTLRAMLQSPHFLYRVESSTTAEEDRIWLNGYELASRLSYALWNTMPSDELLEAAAQGELDTAEGVEGWAKKMLADPRASEVLVSFHEQLFHVKGYGTIAKNASLFPTFTLDLAPVLQQEARLFFNDVAVSSDGGIAAIMMTPVTFVNATTAPFYGVAGDFGSELTRVNLDPNQRAGILTHLGFLSRYGSQAQSDPILRGVHISLDYLCSDLPAPPNDIPPLPPLSDGQTNRQRVEESTSVVPCANCHETVINPLGFAFEHYDAIGQWRDFDNGAPVNAADRYLLDGEEVTYENALELSALLAQSTELHACYSKKWLEFLMGRQPSQVEKGVVDSMAGASLDSESLRNFVASVTALDTFRARPPEVE